MKSSISISISLAAFFIVSSAHAKDFDWAGSNYNGNYYVTGTCNGQSDIGVTLFYVPEYDGWDHPGWRVVIEKNYRQVRDGKNGMHPIFFIVGLQKAAQDYFKELCDDKKIG